MSAIIKVASATDMKRCPECRRDYHDDTLIFCLADGAVLVPGIPDEPATAIVGEPPSESPTLSYADGETHSSDSGITHIASKRNSIIAVAIGIALVSALGLGSYWFYGVRTKQIESIAVMPFVNESGNAEVEYLTEGMTESLINSLTQLPNLNVKPRSSTFRYKGRESEAKTIGSELKVGAILNGRLVQRGDEITLFLALIDTGSENQIWGKQYSRKLANLVALQAELARDVSETLRSRITGPSVQNLAKSHTTDPEAYRLYLQGRFFWNKRTPKDVGKAIGYFQQAINLDPNYALAYAGLADAIAQPSDLIPHAEREKKAKDAALKALALDSELAEAHTALGHLLPRYDLDFEGGERELKRAFELDPKWTDTYQRFTELYSFLGRHEEALEWVRRGLEIEPFSIPLQTAYGASLFRARRYDEAIVQLKKTIELDPGTRQVHIALWGAYWMKGMYAESVDARAKYVELGGEIQEAARLRESFLKGGWEGYLRAELFRFTGDRPIERNSYWSEAIILTGLGEKNKAFDALNKSVETRENPSLAFLKVEPRLDPLRDDPRFAEILKNLRFPD
jgi:TolB-like protein